MPLGGVRTVMALHSGWRVALCVLAAAAAGAWLAPAEGGALRQGLALFVLIGGLWVTQALPLAVTALLVPLLAVVMGLMPLKAALAPFAHPIIFLFLGGFALGAALSRQQLDQALAQGVLRLAGGRRMVAVLLCGALAAFLSMWMSNTATAAVMLPLAVGLLRSEGDHREPGAREYAFVLLVLAYSASLGGIATLVGSPPNAVAAAQLGIGFTEWMRWGLPVAALLWPLMVGVLWATLRPDLRGQVPVEVEPLAWTPARVWTVVIFVATAAGWVGAVPLASRWGITADMDTVVALCALVALTLTGALGWKDVERHAEWGVLLLFGGGLALSEVMVGTGASRYLAELLLAAVAQAHPALLLLGMVAFVVLLTEMVSNTASAALLLPVFVPVAAGVGLPPAVVGAVIAIAASCAFMLPVATPPNAIVFATGRVSQATMMRCGAWLNLVSVATITAFALWVWI